MQLKDFATLADAKLYTQSTLKSSDARMLNERGIFSLIGLADGEVLMQAIEGSVDIPARVKSWFKPSEQGIDIADPNALGILAGMVSADVLTQANSDKLSGYAYVVTQPFADSTEHDFKLSKGTITKTPVTVEKGYCTITTTADVESHNPQIYKKITFENGDFEYFRVAGFRGVSSAKLYRVQCPSFPDMYIDDAYGVVS